MQPPFDGEAAIYADLTALAGVILIDLVLAGDNAVVVGMAAAGLPHDQRRKAIVIGIAAAAVLRILFAFTTTRLLEFGPVLVVAGGLLLLWVAWKLFRETRLAAHQAHGFHVLDAAAGQAAKAPVAAGHVSAAVTAQPKTLSRALVQIVVADISMSLDNVLAVAGTARHRPIILVIGLALSVALMGIAATAIAGTLRRYPWIAYLGLLLIAWVALVMLYDGGHQILSGTGPVEHP